MSDMDIVEVDDDNQLLCNTNENHSLSTEPGNLKIFTFLNYHIILLSFNIFVSIRINTIVLKRNIFSLFDIK